MTRRSLIASVLAAPAFAATRFDRSRLSVLTDEIGTLDEAIAFAREYRLKWVELRAYRPEPESHWRSVKAKLDEAGLGVSFFNSALLKYTLPGTTAVKWEDFYENLYKKENLTPDKLFAAREEALSQSIAAAKVLGAPAIRTFAFWRVADPKSVESRVIELLKPMAARCEREGLVLALENEYATNTGTTSEAMAVVAKTPGLALNWDPQNAVALGETADGASAARIPAARLANVQIKAEGLVGPGQAIDWAGIFAALERNGYGGRFGLETHTLKGPEVNVPASHRSMKRMLELVHEPPA
jgi:sugar phosphate isomerase/epimerase